MMKPSQIAQASEVQDLVDWLRGQYREVRILPDGSIAALWDLMYTRAIVLGADRYGFSRRYCFEDRELASRLFRQLQSEDDELEGYVGRR